MAKLHLRCLISMTPFLYTLIGLASGTFHCSVRREISPCTCKDNFPSSPIAVSCNNMNSFAEVVTSLRGNFPHDTHIALKITNSHLDDLEVRSLSELGMTITSLKMNNNNLSVVPVDSFAMLSDVEFLSLGDNAFTSIPTTILSPLHKLKTLDLAKSRITSVNADDFKFNNDLMYLILHGNVISRLETNCFPRTIRKLSIAYNQLSTLNGTLRNLPDVDWLLLSSNHLESLAGELYDDGASLKMLQATDNDFESLNGALQGATKLNVLNLGHNKLKKISVEDFPPLCPLEKLLLEFNELTSLGSTLRNLPLLKKINVSRNQFEVLSIQQLAGPKYLQTADFSNNNINTLEGRAENEVEWEAHVETLILRHNNLTSLGGALQGILGLKRLYLSYNKINKLTSEDLQGLDQLVELDISHNQLLELRETATTYLPALQFLLASNNHIEALTSEFHGLPSLCLANFSNNAIRRLGGELTAQSRCPIPAIHGSYPVPITVFLKGNPLKCTPDLAAVIAEIKRNNTDLIGTPSCDPDEFSGADLPTFDFPKE